MDKRHQRMLEEVLTIPGNEICADCRAPAPRWASVNLGIFLCVNCASVHRKMGTHRSRVKSVTLDSWTRENITQMKQVGNKASNAEWNPNEKLHPPPTAFTSEERDSDLEKYIRRKYEQGAFRASSTGQQRPPPLSAPTSLNRARENDGRLERGSVTLQNPSANVGAGSRNGYEGAWGENKRNPELNDILSKKTTIWDKDRDLPALPVHSNPTGIAGRPRPVPSRGNTPTNVPTQSNTASTSTQGASGVNSVQGNGQLVDLNGGASSTLPLQINVQSPYSQNAFNPFNQMQQAQQQQGQTQQVQAQFGHSPNPNPMMTGYSTAPLPQNAFQNALAVPSPNPGYSLSTSAPSYGNHPLASFDPLHPASQQPHLQGYQQQQQQQQQNGQGGFGQMSHSVPSGFQNQGFPQQYQNGFTGQSQLPYQQQQFQQQGNMSSPNIQFGYQTQSFPFQQQGQMGMTGNYMMR